MMPGAAAAAIASVAAPSSTGAVSTTAFGPRCPRIRSRSSAASSGLSGATVAPSASPPQSAATRPHVLGRSSATTSPDPTPRRASRRAIPAARASSSRQLSAPPSQTSAGCPGRRRAAAPSSAATFGGGSVVTRRERPLLHVVLQVEALPHRGRYAVARRVAGEGGLGGRVHAPLARVAVLAGRGIEVGAAGAGDDPDVAVGLAAGGDGPRDLAVVEDVDVLVHHHHAFHVEVGAEHGQDRVLGLADQPLLDGDVAGE